MDATTPLPTDALALSAEALDDIVAGLASVHRVVPVRPGDPPGEPRSLRLLGTGTYDVWLITWPGRSEMGGHDHGEALSVMRVVAGALEEEVAGCQRHLEPGWSEVTSPGTVHRLANASGAEATSLHAYSPPLLAVTYHERTHGDLAAQLRVAPVRSRQAEATSTPGWRAAG